MTKDDVAVDGKAILVTQDGYEKLVAELEHLKNIRRKEVAEHIKEAISYGDLSENSEYEEAKNEQAFVEGRIIELEDKIKNVQIIGDKAKGKAAAAVVQVGSTIVVVDQSDKKAGEETYVLVGSTEADPFNGKISNESPLGHALIEKRVGDIVEVDAPKGKVSYKIVKVK